MHPIQAMLCLLSRACCILACSSSEAGSGSGEEECLASLEADSGSGEEERTASSEATEPSESFFLWLAVATGFSAVGAEVAVLFVVTAALRSTSLLGFCGLESSLSDWIGWMSSVLSIGVAVKMEGLPLPLMTGLGLMVPG